MKRLLIIILSAFTFFIFCGLGAVIILTNSIGITIDDRGLFLQMSISGIDDNDTRLMSSYVNKTTTEPLTLVNQTGKSLDYRYYGESSQKPSSLTTYIYGDGIYFEDQGDQVIVKSLSTEYDYIFAQNYLYSSGNTQPYIEINVSDEFDYEEAGSDISSEKYGTLKDGESYEIKLPE